MLELPVEVFVVQKEGLLAVVLARSFILFLALIFVSLPRFRGTIFG